MHSTLRRATLLAAALFAFTAKPALADTPYRQGLDEAWWTGPILASGASTLPKGHMLIEPYLYDAKPYGRLDADGHRHGTAGEDNLGSQTYLLYGVADGFTAGIIPRFGYRRAGGRWSQGLGLGDLTAQAQFRLTQYKEGGHVPTVSLMLQETLPTGRYDHLEGRPNDGFGSGAYSTTVGLNSQYYFWTPNGRILRTRLNVAYTRSNEAKLRDISVYGTPTGFTGKATPGDSVNVDLAFEYSITKSWVAALDVGYQRDAATTVSGFAAGTAYDRRSPVSEALLLAPALEYNFNSRVGVIFGARIVPAGRNTTASTTPVVAVNYVL